VTTKAEIVEEIALLLGVETPRMSTGSTEPREIFDLIDESLGLRIMLTSNRSKPEIARAIVEAAGYPWLANFESRGGTVTRDGLAEVLRAVVFFTRNEDHDPASHQVD
jgi:hypothetical protein